jgi:SapC
METIPLAGNAQLTGNVLFYNKPEPLSREVHGALGVKRSDKPYAFVASAHVVPLTVTEFMPASLSFPIIFVGDARVPVAVMGVNQGDNLYVSEDGQFEPDAYLPAYVRRYPFVFANDGQGDRMIVCIDRQADAVSDQPDVPFFENGEPTEFTKTAIKFLEDFETERRRTDAFVQLMKDLDLLDVKQASFQPRNPDGSAVGEPQLVAEYFAVSEDKLKGLAPEKFAELRDNGALPQIYAHITSLLGWERLIARALLRAQSRAQAAANSN